MPPVQCISKDTPAPDSRAMHVVGMDRWEGDSGGRSDEASRQVEKSSGWEAAPGLLRVTRIQNFSGPLGSVSYMFY